MRNPTRHAAGALQRDLYIESIRRKLAIQPLRPLDHRRAVVQRLVQPDLLGLLSAGQAIEVEMRDLKR